MGLRAWASGGQRCNVGDLRAAIADRQSAICSHLPSSLRTPKRATASLPYVTLLATLPLRVRRTDRLHRRRRSVTHEAVVASLERMRDRRRTADRSYWRGRCDRSTLPRSLPAGRYVALHTIAPLGVRCWSHTTGHVAHATLLGARERAAHVVGNRRRQHRIIRRLPHCAPVRPGG